MEIIDMDHKGNGIGKINNKVVFVPKSIPGDECEIEVIKTHKNYDIAKIKNITKKSVKRIDPLCPYYDTCGGCNISNLDYSEQLTFKENKVKNIFIKYLEIDINPRVIDSEKKLEYRNKITYHYDNKLGLISEFSGVIDIHECLLVSDKVNNLYKKIKENDLSLVKLVTIKECDNGLILSIIGKMNIDNLRDLCIEINVNDKNVYRKEFGFIVLNDIKYQVSDKSFFQINTSNISKLYNEIIRYGEFTKNDVVIDLYCGVGSISLYIAKYVKSVLGIEIVEDAIKDAKENAKINNINNVKFLCGDVSKLIDGNINGDTLIVDPPRIGIDEYSLEVINKSKINKIIYVSCDPMTLVRDIKKLDNYELCNISVVDMFPQTHHVESITVLKRI